MPSQYFQLPTTSNLQPAFSTPRSLALLFAGSALYVGFVDPSVRQSLEGTRNKLKHWSSMFKLSIRVMGSLALLTTGAGLYCYSKNRENLWLLGSGIIFAAWPYTILCMKPTNDYLTALDDALDPKVEMTSGEKYTVLERMGSWVNLHRVRIGLALAAAAVFYLAEEKEKELIVGVVPVAVVGKV